MKVLDKLLFFTKNGLIMVQNLFIFHCYSVANFLKLFPDEEEGLYWIPSSAQRSYKFSSAHLPICLGPASQPANG